jgi:formylglycine-generating enzyme required for sulfatase activity
LSQPTDEQPASAIEPSAFTPLDEAAPQQQKQRHPLRWLLAATGAVFVLVMGFLLTSRSLELVVEAVGETDVSISGLAIPFGGRYLLRPGEYEISVNAEGYHPLATTVTVTDADTQSANLVLAPLPGLLSFDTTPPGATVYIDDEAVGETPLADLGVEAGNRAIRIEASRYLAHTSELEVSGRQLPQQLAVTLQPAWADVQINSDPAGADILIDGEPVGQTPATVQLLQGERELALQLQAYAGWQQALEITAGTPVDLGSITLQPAAGLLSLASQPSGANVTLDGEFQGQTPLDLEISPGQAHRLAVFKPGYKRFNDSIELAAAATDTRTVTLEAQLGDVRINISPASAVLRINGKPAGKGTRTLALPAVEHRLEVSQAGYATQTRRITPRPGLLQRVSITLQTETEARMARNKPEITTAVGQNLLLFNPEESPMADFTMGASRREAGRRANEVLHPVALRRMFYLQTTEVTNAQFRQFQPDHQSGQIEGNSLNRDEQPAVQVSWQQAASFCNWLSKRDGLPPFYRENQGIITGYNPSATGYRLPSEAEWAWAARTHGEELLKFPWGDTFPPADSAGNYADNTSAYVTGRILSGYKDGHVVSAPVASYGASKRGLFDMGGNVAEWVHDVYAIPSANGSIETDPLGAQSGDNFVIRGASWSHSRIAELRLSYRDYGQAGRDDVGFRIARYAE